MPDVPLGLEPHEHGPDRGIARRIAEARSHVFPRGLAEAEEDVHDLAFSTGQVPGNGHGVQAPLSATGVAYSYKCSMSTAVGRHATSLAREPAHPPRVAPLPAGRRMS